jgi:hypothetical protein
VKDRSSRRNKAPRGADARRNATLPAFRVVRAATVSLLAAFTGVPKAVVERMPRVMNGTSVYAAGIQPLIDAEAKFGYIARPFPASEIVEPDVFSK